MTFTDDVRDELAAAPVADRDHAAAELAGLVRCTGALHLRTIDGRMQVVAEVTSRSASVARRAFRLAGAVVGAGGRPGTLATREGTGVRGAARFRWSGDEDPDGVLVGTGLVDADGRPERDRIVPVGWTTSVRRSFVRGVVLGAASFSAPGRPVHVEIRVPNVATGRTVRDLLAAYEIASSHSDTGGGRVVCKSEEAAVDLLQLVGAGRAAQRRRDRQVRAQVRADATRLTNADAANLARSVAAAAPQVAAAQRLVDLLDEEDAPDVPGEVVEVALTRLANPAASMAELGSLLAVPASKATVHRRFAKLGALLAAVDARQDPRED